MVLTHLNYAAERHQVKMLDVVTNDSLLASSDLFPNFPQTEIVDGWFSLIVNGLGGQRNENLLVSPAATTEEREKSSPPAPGSSSLSRIVSEVELEATAETRANTSPPPSGAEHETTLAAIAATPLTAQPEGNEEGRGDDKGSGSPHTPPITITSTPSSTPSPPRKRAAAADLERAERPVTKRPKVTAEASTEFTQETTGFTVSERQGAPGEGPLRTIHLNKPATSLTPKECLAFFGAAMNSVEEEALAHADPMDNKAKMAITLLRAGLRLAVDAVHHINSEEVHSAAVEDKARIAELEEQLHAKDALLAARDDQLSSAVKAHKAAESKLSAMGYQVRALELDVARAQTAYEEASRQLTAVAETAARKEAAAAQKEATAAQKEAAAAQREAAAAQREAAAAQKEATLRQRFSALLAQKKTLYFQQSAARFRSLFLQTPAGQEFLRVMHEGLIAQFVKTRTFMEAAARGLTWIIDRASTATLKQAQATDGQKAMVNPAALPADMGLLELEQVMGIDPSLNPNDWFLPVMEQAARVFVEANRDTPGLPPIGKMLYDLPYFQTLTASRIAEISRERGESSGNGETLSANAEADMLKVMEEEEVGSERPSSEQPPARQTQPREQQEQPQPPQEQEPPQHEPQETQEQPEPSCA